MLDLRCIENNTGSPILQISLLAGVKSSKSGVLIILKLSSSNDTLSYFFQGDSIIFFSNRPHEDARIKITLSHYQSKIWIWISIGKFGAKGLFPLIPHLSSLSYNFDDDILNELVNIDFCGHFRDVYELGCERQGYVAAEQKHGSGSNRAI